MQKQVYLWHRFIHVFLLPISSSISNSYLNDTEPAIVTRRQCISKKQEGPREGNTDQEWESKTETGHGKEEGKSH